MYQHLASAGEQNPTSQMNRNGKRVVRDTNPHGNQRTRRYKLLMGKARFHNMQKNRRLSNPQKRKEKKRIYDLGANIGWRR